jgi:DNA-binding response OmpR family regulator
MAVALVVDDEPLVAMMISLALEEAGFTVIEAYDGQHAVELMAGQDVDVVVTDFMMPRRSGLDLALAIRALRGPRDPPVVLTSAVPGDVLDRHPGIFAAFFQKPYDLDELIDTVRSLVEAEA